MLKSIFSLLVISLLLFSCKGDKPKTVPGFDSIPRDVAMKMISAYADPRVPHDYQNIIKSIQVNAEDFRQLSSGVDSVKLFTAADTVYYKPTIVIQTITRNSPVSYEYFLFSDVRGTICPPPYDCYIEVQ